MFDLKYQFMESLSLSSHISKLYTPFRYFKVTEIHLHVHSISFWIFTIFDSLLYELLYIVYFYIIQKCDFYQKRLLKISLKIISDKCSYFISNIWRIYIRILIYFFYGNFSESDIEFSCKFCMLKKNRKRIFCICWKKKKSWIDLSILSYIFTRTTTTEIKQKNNIHL